VCQETLGQKLKFASEFCGNMKEKTNVIDLSIECIEIHHHHHWHDSPL
jgi:hypothetical protein